MGKTDLQKILGNFDEMQLEIIGNIAIRMASAKADAWTGQITFAVNLAQGGLGDMHVDRKEVVRLQKRRGVRSGGV